MSIDDFILDTSSPEACEIVEDSTLIAANRDGLEWFIDRSGNYWFGDFNSGLLIPHQLGPSSPA